MNKKNLLYFPPYYTLYLKERTIFEIIKIVKPMCIKEEIDDKNQYMITLLLRERSINLD